MAECGFGGAGDRASPHQAERYLLLRHRSNRQPHPQWRSSQRYSKRGSRSGDAAETVFEHAFIPFGIQRFGSRFQPHGLLQGSDPVSFDSVSDSRAGPRPFLDRLGNTTRYRNNDRHRLCQSQTCRCSDSCLTRANADPLPRASRPRCRASRGHAKHFRVTNRSPSVSSLSHCESITMKFTPVP